jgi:pyridoxal/pyridoxine/pyridoxamine kinase
VHSVILLILVEETMCSATQPTSFFTLNWIRFLTGLKIESEHDAWKAIQTLHSRGVKNVIISSVDTPKRDEIRVLGSMRTRTYIYLLFFGSN